MTFVVLALVSACVTAPPPAPAPAPLPARVVTPIPVTGPAVPGGTCPTGMVPVPAGAPHFCIDAWEDQVVDGVAVSLPGVRPTVGITFDAAVAACARAEMRDASGALVGHKRLPLASEWEDALDGTVGPGGHAFPYGDVATPGVCNLPDRGGSAVRHELLPTGARAGCVTPSGAFDLLGNAWEWTDSGERLDIQGWFDRRRREGVQLERTVDDRLLLRAGRADALRLVLNAVRPDALSVATDGSLQVADGAATAGMFTGGFLSAATAAEPAPYLPIVVAPVDAARAAGPWSIRVRIADDGAPVPDKRGCADYAGSTATCRGSDAALAHPHDFGGTIAARCVGPPIGG